MTTFEEFKKCAEECRDILIKEGFTELDDRVIYYQMDRKAKKSLGITTRRYSDRAYDIRTGKFFTNTFTYTITMNWTFVLHSTEKVVRDTIMHEMCHCVNDGMKHTGGWKRAANAVAKYGFDITRTCDSSTIKEYMEIYQPKDTVKYRVVCPKCGVIARRQRDSKMLKSIRLFGAKSGSYCGICGSRDLKVEE